ncbi:DUF4440 domain-containing protein [Olivibacter sp. SDN3]|uniref:YybH family protein n=1 Tax=Olivibacter sp. SDN3 TaxID=2764720 RepID=UPI001650F7E7|nr:DUF4440 domain-containing protein [Olivibacter sp. SDN3]QNL51200.1 DUF4440 domain-containing protein [Olivibacter sp. SDN3]
MHRIFFGVIFLFLVTRLVGQEKSEEAIREVMKQQELAWNKGDIDAFMNGYWKSDSLLFVGREGPIYGWQKARERYLRTYPDSETMGELTFDLLDIKALSADCYFVLGRWALVRNQGNVGGTFTLLFKKINGRWLITTDHTS